MYHRPELRQLDIARRPHLGMLRIAIKLCMMQSQENEIYLIL